METCTYSCTHRSDIAEEVIAQIEGILPPTKEYKDDDELRKKMKEEQRERQQEIRASLQKILLKPTEKPKENITMDERKALRKLQEEKKSLPDQRTKEDASW